MADSFHAFLQNLTVAVTGATHAATVISLPRSQIEMTQWDQEWQDRITKVVRRVARDLMANDESEISEVVRRRLFEDLGGVRTRRRVARTYADWCFERSARLPPEWTAVDSATTRREGARFPAEPVRGMLSVPPSDAFGLPEEVAGTPTVPADPRRAGDAGPVDFVGVARAVPAGAE